MKLFLLLLLATANFVDFSVATQRLMKDDFWWSQKYQLHREPPVEKANFSPFADEVVEVKWIEQRLDNFDPQNEETWQMRYMENNFFLQEGGPIFIYIGGEWTIYNGTLLNSHMRDMASQLNGIMFYTEHRYYGESHPTPNTTAENLQWLNIDQALADLAYFITHVKETNPLLRNSGVILIGGSYSATMATWFMQKYPHLANGAWSSSAPLEAKVDFIEYKEVVTEAIEEVGGAECSRRIENAFNQLETLLAEEKSGEIEELFLFCYPLDLSNELDVWSFFGDVAGPWSGLVQYHREIDQDIQNECDIIVNNPNPNDLEVVASWWWFGDSPPDPQEPFDFCYNHRYSSVLNSWRRTEWNSSVVMSAWRQWFYQTCSEYGWYQSSGSDEILFGSNFPASLYVTYCQDVFDIFSKEIIERNVERTNIIYGAKSPNVRNVYSTHGQFDPWRPMGVQEDINKSSPTVILPGETHCSDLGPIRDYNSPELIASKERIFELVQQWLGISVEAKK